MTLRCCRCGVARTGSTMGAMTGGAGGWQNVMPATAHAEIVGLMGMPAILSDQNLDFRDLILDVIESCGLTSRSSDIFCMKRIVVAPYLRNCGLEIIYVGSQR